MPRVCFADDSLGADAYWAAGLHVHTPLPFRPGRGGLGDKIKTHFFVNTGNLVSLDASMTRGLTINIGFFVAQYMFRSVNNTKSNMVYLLTA